MPNIYGSPEIDRNFIFGQYDDIKQILKDGEKTLMELIHIGRHYICTHPPIPSSKPLNILDVTINNPTFTLIPTLNYHLSAIKNL